MSYTDLEQVKDLIKVDEKVYEKISVHEIKNMGKKLIKDWYDFDNMIFNIKGDKIHLAVYSIEYLKKHPKELNKIK